MSKEINIFSLFRRESRLPKSQTAWNSNAKYINMVTLENITYAEIAFFHINKESF